MNLWPNFEMCVMFPLFFEFDGHWCDSALQYSVNERLEEPRW